MNCVSYSVIEHSSYILFIIFLHVSGFAGSYEAAQKDSYFGVIVHLLYAMEVCSGNIDGIVMLVVFLCGTSTTLCVLVCEYVNCIKYTALTGPSNCVCLSVCAFLHMCPFD